MIIALATALLLACGLILWLVWANQQLHRIVKEQQAQNDNLYEAGIIAGRREATVQYRASKPYQDGYQAGYIAARDELIAIAAETDVVRQTELKRC